MPTYIYDHEREARLKASAGSLANQERLGAPLYLFVFMAREEVMSSDGWNYAARSIAEACVAFCRDHPAIDQFHVELRSTISVITNGKSE